MLGHDISGFSHPGPGSGSGSTISGSDDASLLPISREAKLSLRPPFKNEKRGQGKNNDTPAKHKQKAEGPSKFIFYSIIKI